MQSRVRIPKLIAINFVLINLVLFLALTLRANAQGPHPLDAAETFAKTCKQQGRHGKRHGPNGDPYDEMSVLVTGGFGQLVGDLSSAEIYDANTGSFTATANMTVEREGHTMTALPNGNILVAGGIDQNFNGRASAELFIPSKEIFRRTGNMTTRRVDHTATLLPNGTVLLAGGTSQMFGFASGHILASAEIYHPNSGHFVATGKMSSPRFYHTATLLPNGLVLIAGGDNLPSGLPGITLNTAELYSPATGTFKPTGSMIEARANATANLLPNGKVLIAGGFGDDTLASAELYDPSTGTFALTGSMNTERALHTAIPLPDGTILVAAGVSGEPSQASAEIYNPASGTFTLTGSLNMGRRAETGELLGNGEALIVGGFGQVSPDSFSTLASAELFNPNAGSFTFFGDMTTMRESPTALALGAICDNQERLLITTSTSRQTPSKDD
jgi:hypothetical protein